MSDSESRKLSELRVVDLRLELENRGLDKNGVKQVLMDRLQKALIDQGENPDTFLFKLSEDKAVDRSRKSSVTGKNDSEKTDTEETIVKSTSSTENQSSKEENGDEKDVEKSQKDEDHESPPITLTLEEEEKIHDEEATSELTPKERIETDEKKSTNEESTAENGDKSTDAEGTKKEAAESTSSADGRKVPGNSNPRAIWISNVAMNTRACDVKQALSKYGKVVGAKVVVNAKYPGTCCFGYVTMGSVDDANRVIENLNNTELNGQIIKIEKFDTVRSEQLKQMKNGKKSPERTKPSSSSRKEKSPSHSRSHKEDSEIKKSETKDKTNSSEESDKNEPDNSDKKSEKGGDQAKDEKEDGKEKPKDEDKKRQSGSDRKSRDRKRSGERARSRSREKKTDVLTFEKIREARERQRFREKERLLREEARRRHEESLRQKEIERRQRSEAQRLEREREKLRIERERIEREKNELIKLERERQKLERERIELEKMELQRSRFRLEEDRRAVKRPAAPYRREDNFDDRKRHFAETAPHYDSKMRDSPAKKFPNKDYKATYDKRDSDKRSSDRYDSDRNRRSYDSMRDRDVPPSVSSRITKDHRFGRDRDRSPHYRPGDRRVGPDGKPSTSPRIPTGPLIVPRFDSWNSSSTPKTFNSKWPKDDNWRQNAPSDRWNSSGRNQNFGTNSNMNMTPSCPPPPGINTYPDRFDYNKVPSSIRKY